MGNIILTRSRMGGPCLLSNSNSARKVLGPACTDNFQIIPFSYLGKTWYSVEQCYQAQKFPEGSESREKLEKCAPLPDENGSVYGHRVWRLGQRLRGMVLAWEDNKVETMFLVNAAKYNSNPELQKDLLETGDLEITGGASTWQWSKWNGLIQMKIRDLLQQGINLNEVQKMPMDSLLR